jgi:hypothetical protein
MMSAPSRTITRFGFGSIVIPASAAVRVLLSVMGFLRP